MARNFGHLQGGEGALISDSARECSLHVGNAKHYQNGDETLFSLCWDDGRQFSVERVLKGRRSKDADVRDLNILIFYYIKLSMDSSNL